MKSIKICSSFFNIEEWVNPDTGRYHREDGPALIAPNNGKLIHYQSQEEFKRFLKLKAFW